MTQEEKELLLKDLCARLPYDVKVDITFNKEHGSSDRLRICSEGLLTLNTDLVSLYVEDEIYLKPYLRPMSSISSLISAKEWSSLSGIDLIDWYNANHIDYRGLIEKGLALEAPKGMYK